MKKDGKASNTARTLLIISAVLLISALLRAFGEQQGAEKSPYTVIQVHSINACYAEATKIASVWESDSYLSYFSSTFSLEKIEEELFIGYGFRSYSEPGKWLNIYCVPTTPAKVRISKGVFSEGEKRPLTKEILVDKLEINSLDAITIAIKNGGEEFLRENNTIDEDSFVELQQEYEAFGTGRLVWIVAFISNRSSVMYITIDSSSGEIIDVWKNDE